MRKPARKLDLKNRARLARRLVKAAVGRDVAHRKDIILPVERHGGDYGGWVIYGRPLGPDSVVYSFGVGEDIGFDLSIITTLGVTVHAFDPTPKAVAWINARALPNAFHFHRMGIADFDGQAIFNAPPRSEYASYTLVQGEGNPGGAVKAEVRRLGTIMDELGHDHVDLLKLDVEGAEYGALADVVASGIDVRQILVEFHHAFESIGLEETNEAVALLRRSGFRLFHISPRGEEYSFIRMDRI